MKKEKNFSTIIIFYLNVSGNGKGKEYNFEGELEYEGEYKNEKRNGKGKEYYYNGQLRFEGEYLNDRKWTGKGLIY